MDKIILENNKVEQVNIDNSSIKILLVDDREENLFSVGDILQQDGYELRKANSGRNALKVLLKEQDFSLILMDVQMPGLDGFETASLIYERDKLKHIPIIFITAFEYGEANIYKGYSMGAVDYIYKPINKDLLRAKIAVFIELYKKNRQLRLHEQNLLRINGLLEQHVRERTKELINANEELKEKNAELEKVNKDLDNFIYSASHDLKAPIANIEGLFALLKKRIEGTMDEEGRRILDMIALCIQKFNSTIKDLSDIAKVQKDINEQRETLLFKDVFEDIKVDSQKLLQLVSPSIVEFYDAPHVSYARKNLRSICYNLFSNALKYRDDKKPLTITIQTYRRNGYTVLSVSDNGLGISEEHQKKLFSMFRRFHTHVEGTGIGLYIVKRVVENCGGKIEIESEQGKGSTFRVYFKDEDKS